MKEWDLKSLLRILNAVDQDSLIKALIELGLWEEARNSGILQAREINNFLVSLIPLPGAWIFNKLLQEGLDWLLGQPVKGNLNLNNCAATCSNSINACSIEIKRYEHSLRIEIEQRQKQRFSFRNFFGFRRR